MERKANNKNHSKIILDQTIKNNKNDFVNILYKYSILNSYKKNHKKLKMKTDRI